MSIRRALSPLAKRTIKAVLPLAGARRLQQFFGDLHGLPSPQGVPGDISIAVETTIAAEFLPAGNAVIVDVGANHGAWTTAMLARGGGRIGQIIAVEPQSALMPTLEAIAHQDARVQIINTAMGRSAGSAVLYSDKVGSGLASLTKRKLDHVAIDMSLQEHVEVVSLDCLAQSMGFDHIDVLKLDIEGHELDALSGAGRLLSEKRIGYIQFEFGGCNIDTRTYLRDFWHFFNDRNYSIGLISLRGQTPILIPLTQYKEALENFTTTNYGAWPRP